MQVLVQQSNNKQKLKFYPNTEKKKKKTLTQHLLNTQLLTSLDNTIQYCIKLASIVDKTFCGGYRLLRHCQMMAMTKYSPGTITKYKLFKLFTKF